MDENRLEEAVNAVTDHIYDQEKRFNPIAGTGDALMKLKISTDKLEALRTEPDRDFLTNDKSKRFLQLAACALRAIVDMDLPIDRLECQT